jgi:5-methylcytosine-specific restriction endonuclease McrA
VKLDTLPPRVASPDLRRVPPAPKQVDPHYLTPEHRAWRGEVIRRARGRCCCCGRSGGRLFADHIIERRDGGDPVDPGNGQALCGACHTVKTARARAARQSATP